jgi:hypothetical protein
MISTDRKAFINNKVIKNFGDHASYAVFHAANTGAEVMYRWSDHSVVLHTFHPTPASIRAAFPVASPS